jgi:hypothetical protein
MAPKDLSRFGQVSFKITLQKYLYLLSERVYTRKSYIFGAFIRAEKGPVFLNFKLIIFNPLRQYAINGSNGNAMAFYDKCIDLIKTNKSEKCDKNQLTTSNVSQNNDLLVEIYQDKSRIEGSKENFDKAIDFLKDAMLYADK